MWQHCWDARTARTRCRPRGSLRDWLQTAKWFVPGPDVAIIMQYKMDVLPLIPPNQRSTVSETGGWPWFFASICQLPQNHHVHFLWPQCTSLRKKSQRGHHRSAPTPGRKAAGRDLSVRALPRRPLAAGAAGRPASLCHLAKGEGVGWRRDPAAARGAPAQRPGRSASLQTIWGPPAARGGRDARATGRGS